ncbi:hypothetical protein HY837_02705 [archaeon]|nr:hypothetical protein [archaeon]
MNYKFVLLLFLGLSGLLIVNEFTGKQVVKLDVSATNNCPIQVIQASSCDDSKTISASYTAAESRDQEVICSLAEAKAKLSCKEMNCADSCPSKFTKTNESLTDHTCVIEGACNCRAQEEIEVHSQETKCQSLCVAPPKSCEPVTFNLSPEIARKLVEVSEAYKKGSGQGDQLLGDLLRSSACAFGLQYAPVSLINVADQVKKYSSFEVCGTEIEVQPDFNQLSAFLRNPQMPSLKGIAKISKGLTAEVRIDSDGAYRAEMNLDLCAFIRK